MLPSISPEQHQVIDALENNHNVIVNSVAGSGKTTCNLHIAKHFSGKNMLLLTYNAKLKIETREKIKLLKYTNIETHSYHSFCVKYYNDKCFTDNEIIELVKTPCAPPTTLFSYDIIILDEAQDISPLYYELICKIFMDLRRYPNNPLPQIVILGDQYQSIFDFNNADQRFITLADKVFRFNHLSWKKCKLSRSFRITFEMSEFINHTMMKTNHIQSQKITNIKPRYIICNCFGENSGYNRIYDEIKYYLSKGYAPQDIFVLAPSVKSPNSPVRKLENKLKMERPDIPVFVPTGDDIKLDGEILDNKLVFSTFHQSKGLERKVVLVLSFDDGYFNFFKKDHNPKICPNELYVATTRALEHLSVFHHYENECLSFLEKDLLETYCEVIVHRKQIIKKLEDGKVKPPEQIAVCDLIRHLTPQLLEDCYQLLTVEQISPAHKNINIPVKTKQKRLKNGIELNEEVSEITGVAIPSYLEYMIKGNIEIFDMLLNEKTCETVVKYYDKYNKNHKMNTLTKITPDALLKISNCWNSYKNGFLFKLEQITHYNWLSKKNLRLCVENMKRFHFDKSAKFEVHVSHTNKFTVKRIVGFIDCVFHNILFEFKCVVEIKKEHMLQLALYYYLYKNKFPGFDGKCYLYNILTDELILLKSDYEEVEKMVDFLIENKFSGKKYVPDKTFLLQTKMIFKKQYNNNE